MTPKWVLKAEITPTYTDESGNDYTNVITVIHWRLTDGVNLVDDMYGSESVRLPTDPSQYIPLSDLQALPEEQRRDAIMVWAEAIRPGFIQDHLDQFSSASTERQSKPVKTVVDLV